MTFPAMNTDPYLIDLLYEFFDILKAEDSLELSTYGDLCECVEIESEDAPYIADLLTPTLFTRVCNYIVDEGGDERLTQFLGITDRK